MMYSNNCTKLYLQMLVFYEKLLELEPPYIVSQIHCLKTVYTA
jgi:hypothetical protein